LLLLLRRLLRLLQLLLLLLSLLLQLLVPQQAPLHGIGWLLLLAAAGVAAAAAACSRTAAHQRLCLARPCTHGKQITTDGEQNKSTHLDML
jgi:hypothetical protein